MSELRERINEDVKVAMRARDKERLGVLRLITAAIKQKEVDQRIDMDDTAVLAVLDKMAKQYRDAIAQYRDAGRKDLLDKEEFELSILQEFLPSALGEKEINQLIEDAIAETGAAGMQDMGKVMAILRSRAQGRADMGALSGMVKARLT